MRKTIISFVAALMLMFGMVAASQSPAMASGALYCNTGWWYLHGPYPVNGGMWTWATCVPQGTAVNYPDSEEISNKGFDTQVVQVLGGSGWYNAGINYNQAGTVGVWTDTTYATAGPCIHSALYRSQFRYWTGVTWAWITTGQIVRC